MSATLGWAQPRVAQASLADRVRGLLPHGVPLTDAAWRRRHRVIQATLYAMVPFLVVVGAARGFDAAHLVLDIAPILALAVAGNLARSRRLKAAAASGGLLTACAVLVHLTGGLIESHFSYFVILPLIALYQDLVAFGLAVVFVAVEHAVMTLLVPDSVFNHPAALARPWLWGAIHAAYVLALVCVMLAYLRFAERSQLELSRTSTTLARTAAEVERVGQQLARSADAQSVSVDMINDGLVDVQQRIGRSGLARDDGELVASLNEVVNAARLIGDLTAQHAENSERAASATKDLTAQASHLSSVAAATG